MPSMIITADWEHTETTVKGEQTEVVVPLPALKAVDPADDKIIAQILRELTPSADEDLPAGQDPPPWRRLRLDRGECHLSILLEDTPEVLVVKQLVDDALRDASAALAEHAQQRSREEAEEQALARKRHKEAAKLRHAFRGAGSAGALHQQAKRVEEPHLIGISAANVQQLRAAHEHRLSARARNGDVQAVAAE
jgi:hypothetical protein